MEQDIRGRRIVAIEPLPQDAAVAADWSLRAWHRPVALKLDDGTYVIASQDAEMNGPGDILQFDPASKEIYGFGLSEEGSLASPTP